ncbi:hypothetical protein SAMN02745227_00873 [Anaerobranca californiensis DSM 14826]|uniref:ECF transporter S component n=1 Tax=Anaerobranca californiensis DSM 14826 TaxID=1120989 RepID=A0A1M6MPK8_9FIRM|nr:ECF transporter S component [Anaerobranca californiensis]SHJ85372.1 hypothetical protein SAMN02745227_00873 [Anaerobranca californiensis DSM 14826]
MKNTVFITRTAIFLALALVFQIYFRTFAQPVVGPLVNFVLFLTTMLVGITSAIIVGSLTPLIAFSFGIMPLFPVVPFIMVGNILMVAIYYFISKNSPGYLSTFLGVLAAAFGKFLFLALAIRYVAPLFLPQVPPPIVQALSLPQFYTALTGGILSILVAKGLERVNFKKETF